MSDVEAAIKAYIDIKDSGRKPCIAYIAREFGVTRHTLEYQLRKIREESVYSFRHLDYLQGRRLG